MNDLIKEIFMVCYAILFSGYKYDILPGWEDLFMPSINLS